MMLPMSAEILVTFTGLALPPRRKLLLFASLLVQSARSEPTASNQWASPVPGQGCLDQRTAQSARAAGFLGGPASREVVPDPGKQAWAGACDPCSVVICAACAAEAERQLASKQQVTLSSCSDSCAALLCWRDAGLLWQCILYRGKYFQR